MAIVKCSQLHTLKDQTDYTCKDLLRIQFNPHWTSADKRNPDATADLNIWTK